MRGTFRGSVAHVGANTSLTGGSWAGNRGRQHLDEVRAFGRMDGIANWQNGATRVINTNCQRGATSLIFPGDLGMVNNVGSGLIAVNGQGAPVPFAAAYNVSGKYVSGPASNNIITATFENNTIVTNPPGVAMGLFGLWGLTSTTLYIPNGAACTLPTGLGDINSNPVFQTLNGGTLTGSFTHFLAQSFAGSGTTLTTRSGFQMNDDAAPGGAITNQYGLDVPILIQGGTANTAVRIGRGGQTLTAGIAGPGQIDVYQGTTTINFASAGMPVVLNIGGTFLFQQSANALGFLSVLNIHPTLTTTTASLSYGPVNGLAYSPTFNANGVTLTSAGFQIGYNFAPVTSITSGGIISAGTFIGMQAQGNFGAGTTTTLYQGFFAAVPTIGGTLTTWVGVDVAAVTGAGTNIGLRNASPTVFTPTGNQTLAAATVINPNATAIQVIQTSGANITLTGTPTITAGQSGQILIIDNVSTVAGSTFTLQSNASLAGSNLSLGAATRVLGLKGSITLKYNTALTRWVEVSFNAGGNG